MSQDQTIGADRHDLRPHLIDAEGAEAGLAGRIAQAVLRLLGRGSEEPGNGAALSRVAGGDRPPTATARK